MSAQKRAPRRTALVEHIRSKIVAGELQPGAQLPSRAEMIGKFGACRATLQDAFDELKLDGFVESRAGEGTFVTDNPPHLSRYGVVFGPDPSGVWRPFTFALRREIPGIEKEQDCQFALYDNVTAHSDTVEYRELIRDVRSHRVAGLLFYGDVLQFGLLDTPLIANSGIPRVVLGAVPIEPISHPGLVSICIDDHAFFDRALDHLHQRGRRRVALLEGWESSQEDISDFMLRAERRGMTVKPHWILELSVKQARKVTELLLSLSAGERPDALLLTSESLIEPVGAGILASDVQAGRDLDVVAICNMPCVGSTPVPMRRLGTDMRQRLRVALDLLKSQFRGQAVPPSVMLPPVFEEELSRPPKSPEGMAVTGRNCSVAARGDDVRYTELSEGRAFRWLGGKECWDGRG